ncbi:hypothetical protein [Pseudophaeobacter sp.]|uniref:hypothetical protein n=1 Tax=Pseudophaeobacter sp. TaxID=1971739 RepID=UPI003299D735
MIELKPALQTLAVAFTFCAVSPVLSKDIAPVLFQCDMDQHPVICGALMTALQSKALERAVELSNEPANSDALQTDQNAVLTIRYQEESRTEDRLSGRLVWLDQEGRRVDGPVLELTIMDSNLSALDLSPYARTLVDVSDLPL